MNQTTLVHSYVKAELHKIRNLDWRKLSKTEVNTLRRKMVKLSIEKNGNWATHDILMLYTNLFINFKPSLPNLGMVTRELDAISKFLHENNLPYYKFKFVKRSLWLAAKWGYDDPSYVNKCIQLLSTELRNGASADFEDLSNILWSYATLLPLGKRPKLKFLNLWLQSFEKIYRDIPIDSHNWIKAIPALELLGIPLPNGDSINPYFEEYLKVSFPPSQSGFEKEVNDYLKELGVIFHRDARISIYSPDFVIEHRGKKLVVECDGPLFHPFPNLLRNKILRLHGYYVAHLTGDEFNGLNKVQRINVLSSIIKEMDHT